MTGLASRPERLTTAIALACPRVTKARLLSTTATPFGPDPKVPPAIGYSGKLFQLDVRTDDTLENGNVNCNRAGGQGAQIPEGRLKSDRYKNHILELAGCGLERASSPDLHRQPNCISLFGNPSILPDVSDSGRRGHVVDRTSATGPTMFCTGPIVDASRFFAFGLFNSERNF